MTKCEATANQANVYQCSAPQCGKMIRKGELALHKSGLVACSAQCAHDLNRLGNIA